MNPLVSDIYIISLKYNIIKFKYNKKDCKYNRNDLFIR